MPVSSPNQQMALAQFGEFALRCDDLDDILQEACRLVGEALQTPLVKVMELQDEGRSLLVRAGIGWKPGVVGHAKIAAAERTAEHHVLTTREPAISSDIATEDRFHYPDFIRDNGVQALATVLIVGWKDEAPYGVLQVDSREPRVFTGEETQFLRSYANLLAAAVGRRRMLAELSVRAEENERMLRELQHRVKNNLQTVMALVRRAVRTAPSTETVTALQAVGDGIEALRLIHEKIYLNGGGSDRACLGTYLGDLAVSLLAFHGSDAVAKIRLVCEVEVIDVPSDTAIPFGLITSEFVTNSLRYAFDDGQGLIGLRVEALAAGTIRVTLWDDGKGLPSGTRSGTGISLINGLARQVGGTATWSSDAGTCLTITLPKEAR